MTIVTIDDGTNRKVFYSREDALRFLRLGDRKEDLQADEVELDTEDELELAANWAGKVR